MRSGGKAAGILGGLAVTAAILAVMVFITTVLGGSLLKFMGMEYRSFWSVFLFFVIYFIVDFPIDLLVEAFPKALRALGRLKSKWSQVLLYAVLDIPVNCCVMMAIDYFMDSVQVPFPAAAAFSTALCGLNLYLERKEGKGCVRVYLAEKNGQDLPESRQLLREALTLYCEDKCLACGEADLEICTGSHGKPFAARRAGEKWSPRDDLHFSVTHTDHWWLCAVYGQPLGVDMEEQDRRVNQNIAQRFFSQAEQQWLEARGKTAEHFLELWVRKEAYVKYLGTGLTEGMNSFSAAGPAERPGGRRRRHGSDDETAPGAETGTETGKDAGTDAELVLFERIGSGDRKAFCGRLFPEDMRDQDGFPVPLIGAICTAEPPEGIEIGFLERTGEEDRGN